MRILTLTTKAHGGGAERVALDLARKLGEMGHETHVRVRADQPAEPPLVSPVPFRKSDLSLGKKIAYYGRRLVQELGVELISAPTLPHLFKDLPFEPDIIHLHNFRENFLRLADLEALCRRAPVVWTWHDMWPITGHCAHSLDCERWLARCGQCPYLNAYVRLHFDLSRFNHARRRYLYQRIASGYPASLQVVCPSLWLANIAKNVSFGRSPVKAIPNGIDMTVFRPHSPEEKKRTRTKIGIAGDSIVVLFAAHGGKKNLYKDYETLEKASLKTIQQCPNLICMTVGNHGVKNPVVQKNNISLGVITDRREMAALYAAADIYVHSTHADTFPLTVLESMASGLPVITSNVCGLPEMVDDGKTGLLIEPSDVDALSEAMYNLLTDGERRMRMGEAGFEKACDLYDLETVAQQYATLFEQMYGKTDL